MAKIKIVIVGGSFGGINAAYGLRRELRKNAEITVISRDPEFTFTPSLLWLIMGWRQPDQIQMPLAGRGIRFIHDEVLELDAAKGEVRTQRERFPYDFLVIGSGAELDYAAISGLGPAPGFTHSTFTIREAPGTRDALKAALAADRGRIIIGAAPGASCIGPAYEIVLMIDTVLRKMRRRHLFQLALVTPEPFLGHFGIGGVGSFPRLIQDEFAERDIETVTAAQKMVSVAPTKVCKVLTMGFLHAEQRCANPIRCSVAFIAAYRAARVGKRVGCLVKRHSLQPLPTTK